MNNLIEIEAALDAVKYVTGEFWHGKLMDNARMHDRSEYAQAYWRVDDAPKYNGGRFVTISLSFQGHLSTWVFNNCTSPEFVDLTPGDIKWAAEKIKAYEIFTNKRVAQRHEDKNPS